MSLSDYATTAYFIFLAALIGAVGGSFVNCLSWRYVREEKVTKGRSRCTHCGHVLGALDLIPIVSWVGLRGRCRYCGEKISTRYVLAEVLMALVAVGLLFRFGLTLRLPFYLFYAFVLLAVALIDLESYEIPDRFHIVAIFWWLAGAALFERPFLSQLLQGLIGGLAVAGGMLSISLIFDRILGRESLGGGDIKLLFVTGLYLGLAVNLLNLVISCFFGLALAAATAKVREDREDPAAIPFGPAIAASTALCLIFGESIVQWYLRFCGL